MRGNKKRDTRPELFVRGWLRNAGLTGYRLHWPVAGRPDIAFPSRRIAIFVQGCFWHGCKRCAIATPKHNAPYWSAKIVRNRARDAKNMRALRAAGWRVFRLRECEVRLGGTAALQAIRIAAERTAVQRNRKTTGVPPPASPKRFNVEKNAATC